MSAIRARRRGSSTSGQMSSSSAMSLSVKSDRLNEFSEPSNVATSGSVILSGARRRENASPNNQRNLAFAYAPTLDAGEAAVQRPLTREKYVSSSEQQAALFQSLVRKSSSEAVVLAGGRGISLLSTRRPLI